MDPWLWLVLAAGVAVILLAISLIRRKHGTDKEKAEDTDGEGEAVAAQGGQRRVRNLRARAAALRRARAAVAGDGEGDEEEEGGLEEGEGEDLASPFQKMGTKKLRRIKEKAEKKALREQEEALREDRKRREALKEEERKQEDERERERKKLEEEEQERLRKEREQREHEEYLQLKESFVVEEEGEGAEEEEEERGVQDFINYIQGEKVVYLENLASEFNMKTQDAIDRVQKLQETGQLTGVVDDRGKFIYISQEELQAVARFIRQRGRVSLAELANSSNSLINLQPDSISVR